MKRTTKQDALQGSAADKLIDAAVDIRMSPDAVERSYMARQLVQCTLPHSDPGNVPAWSRTNGSLTLKIRPDTDSANKPLYPYGSIPRLLLFWLVTEATQKKTRRIRLGHSLDAFMRDIGLNPRTGGGKRGDAARLQSQMERLFGAMISFHDEREHSRSWVNMPVTRSGTLWWDPARSQQDNLWESWVELGEDFYEAITAAPVPVDMRALRALKRSPLALDLYAWLAHTAFAANRKSEPRIVPWDGLHGQMGSEYAELRQFRAKVLQALKKIQLVYPTLKLDTTSAALIVHPSPTAIPARSKPLLGTVTGVTQPDAGAYKKPPTLLVKGRMSLAEVNALRGRMVPPLRPMSEEEYAHSQPAPTGTGTEQPGRRHRGR